MTDQQIKDAIRGFLKSWTLGDTTQALSLFTEDTVWVTSSGTFKGITQIGNYIKWINGLVKDYKITENGIGIVVQGDTGIIEHDLSGTINGNKVKFPAMCVWEFKNGKVVNLRTFSDRLALAQQAAKGMFAKWAVNAVVNGTQKGLTLPS
jgi:ketosteroid isomerase-like protein